MERETFRTVMMRDVDAYASDAIASVLRNSHMNLYRPTTPTVGPLHDEIKTWLYRYVDRCVDLYKGSDRIMDVADSMKNAARDYRAAPFILPDLRPHDQELIDALLVDFINFTFGRRAIDMGMYTIDIQ